MKKKNGNSIYFHSSKHTGTNLEKNQPMNLKESIIHVTPHQILANQA